MHFIYTLNTMLFLLYINDVNNAATNQIKHFADDSVLYRNIPCSAAFHVTPSEDNFHKFAIPAIRVMQPLYGAALI